MIGAAVNSWSCFCWLYRAFPSSPAKIWFWCDHLVMSMCRIVFCVVGRRCLLWPMHSLGKTVLAFALLHFVLLRPNLPVTTGISWLSTFAFQSPMMKRTSFFGVSSRRSYRSSQNPVSFFSISGWGIDLDYCDIEWFALEINKNHSVIFDITLKYAFWILLLTMRATPFLLRDFCPQVDITDIM